MVIAPPAQRYRRYAQHISGVMWRLFVHVCYLCLLVYVLRALEGTEKQLGS
jgi:hypothetical protein